MGKNGSCSCGRCLSTSRSHVSAGLCDICFSWRKLIAAARKIPPLRQRVKRIAEYRRRAAERKPLFIPKV